MRWNLTMLDSCVRRVTVFGLLLLAAFQAEAQLEIEITEYAGKQTPVAVVPFGWEGQEPAAPFGSDPQRSFCTDS
jgi:Tol biopolymer transport system component